MAAVSARAFFLSKTTKPQPLFSRHVITLPPRHQSISILQRRSVATCLISGVDGGGVSDDFVSTRKSGYGHEFSVIANMLNRIEPLDNSVISKGVSDYAKDSMKETISTMLGLLPSNQFDVTVRVCERPMNRLLASSIITGYTLWNAEYRMSLVRNYDIFTETLEKRNCSDKKDVLEEGCTVEDDVCTEDKEKTSLQNLENLSPEALKYIQQLELDLVNAQQELHAQKKQGSIEIESVRENNNDLLKYLRSLEADMVTELSRPSSLEVDEIIQQLVENIMQKFFRDDATSSFMGDLAVENSETCKDINDEFSDTFSTSRDYLAKLLFWCMLLGHHLRGLENRLHLSCVVGLL